MICRIGSSDFDATCSFIMSRQTMWQSFSDDLYEEAEQYIVNAIQTGLIEGRMDQIKEEFAVT